VFRITYTNVNNNYSAGQVIKQLKRMKEWREICFDAGRGLRHDNVLISQKSTATQTRTVFDVTIELGLVHAKHHRVGVKRLLELVDEQRQSPDLVAHRRPDLSIGLAR